MDYSWLQTSSTAIMMVVISSIGIYIALILFTRIYGVRSFSKMSSFDFAVTVGIGTVIASTILDENPPLFQSIAALGSLFVLQMTVSKFREYSFMRTLVDNKPILLMNGADILQENMKRAKTIREDLLSKLREANVTQFSQVKVVVMETTGDISVLHHQDTDHKIDEELIEDIRFLSFSKGDQMP